MRARLLKRPQRNPDTVADPDKIAHLAAVGIIGILGAEQADPTGFADLRVQLSGDRALAALVVFVRPLDVEEFESGPARGTWSAGRDRVLDPAVEQGLAPSISIERPQPA